MTGHRGTLGAAARAAWLVCGLVVAARAAPAAQRVASPPPALVALLDAAPGVDAGWSATLLQAAGSPQALVVALAPFQVGARARVPFGRRWGTEQRAALLAALGRAPGDARSAALAAFRPASRPEALALLEALGRCGGPRDLAAAQAAVQALPRPSPAEARVLGGALAALLQAAPDAQDALARELDRYPDEARAAVLTGLAAAPSPLAFGFARRSLEGTSRTSREALTLLAVAAGTVTPLERAGAAPAVRAALGSRDPDVALAAVLAARALRDVDAAARLVALLDARAPALRSATQEALAALADLPFETERRDWIEWLRREESWVRASSALAGVLARGSESRAGSAVREVASHALHRPARGRLLGLALEHRAPSVRAAAAAALAQVPTEEALAALVRAAEGDHDEGVRAAARAAVASLTRPGG